MAVSLQEVVIGSSLSAVSDGIVRTRHARCNVLVVPPATRP
jgi:hypothetical protein